MDNHFILIGTPKSGSSTLYEYLASHPETKILKSKEYNFFMNKGYQTGKINMQKVYRRKIIFWMASKLPFLRKKMKAKYFKVCKKKDGYYSADGSINYFHNKEVPKRVKQFVPNAKLILILRNPIDRVYSNYWMNFKQSEKDKNWKWQWNSFEDFIDKGGHKNSINQYPTNLKRWLHYFSLEEILIIDSSSLFKNTKKTLCTVEEFLGVVNVEYSENIWITPNAKKPSDYPKISPKTRGFLKTYFTPQVKELQELTGKKFNWKDFD